MLAEQVDLHQQHFDTKTQRSRTQGKSQRSTGPPSAHRRPVARRRRKKNPVTRMSRISCALACVLPLLCHCRYHAALVLQQLNETTACALSPARAHPLMARSHGRRRLDFLTVSTATQNLAALTLSAWVGLSRLPTSLALLVPCSRRSPSELPLSKYVVGQRHNQPTHLSYHQTSPPYLNFLSPNISSPTIPHPTGAQPTDRPVGSAEKPHLPKSPKPTMEKRTKWNPDPTCLAAATTQPRTQP